MPEDIDTVQLYNNANAISEYMLKNQLNNSSGLSVIPGSTLGPEATDSAIALLGEINVFDPESTMSRQSRSMGSALKGEYNYLTGDKQRANQYFNEAALNSGQAILTEEGASEGVFNAYYGAIGTSAMATTFASGALARKIGLQVLPHVDRLGYATSGAIATQANNLKRVYNNTFYPGWFNQHLLGRGAEIFNGSFGPNPPTGWLENYGFMAKEMAYELYDVDGFLDDMVDSVYSLPNAIPQKLKENSNWVHPDQRTLNSIEHNNQVPLDFPYKDFFREYQNSQTKKSKGITIQNNEDDFSFFGVGIDLGF